MECALSKRKKIASSFQEMGASLKFVIVGRNSHRPESRRLCHVDSRRGRNYLAIYVSDSMGLSRLGPRSKSLGRPVGNGIRETPWGIRMRIRVIARAIRMADRETIWDIPRGVLDYKPPGRIRSARPILVSRMRHFEAQTWPSDRRAPVIIIHGRVTSPAHA